MITSMERRFDVDWLRFLATCAVFLFHSARFFDDGGWHVKNALTEFSMTVFVNVFAQWIMPIFFVLSGISTYYSMSKKQCNASYLKQRFKRLMVPLIFGIFTMIPLQVYFERVSHSQFTGTFFEFYPHYFDGFYAFGGNFAWMGLHLWYLLFLYIFTVFALPLLVYLRKSAGQRGIKRFADFLTRPGMIFLFFLPVTILDFAILPNASLGTRDMGGWNLFTYLFLYICGYILANDIRFKETIEKYRQAGLILGIVSLGILYYWLVYYGRPQMGYNLSHFLLTAGRCFNSWCFLIALLGYGSKYLGFNNNLLRYTNRLVLPFYILHQTVIITIGFYVVQWDVSVASKYLVISISSLAVIMLMYEILIKRVKLLRVLFGMG